MSILEDIGGHLITNGVVDGVTGWVVTYGYIPASPDQVVALHESGGSQDPDQTGGVEHTFPTFQVLVRGQKLDYATVRTKIQEVVDTLNNATVAGYVYVYPTDSGPVLLRNDMEDERPELTWNFKAMKV